MTEAATLPALLRHQARLRPNAPAMREKKLGVWETHSWFDAYAATGRIAFGLAAIGFKEGDRVCVVGDNRPRMYWLQLAVQILGGIAVPLDANRPTEELLGQSGLAAATWIVLDGTEQLNRFASFFSALPAPNCILVDAEGLAVEQYGAPLRSMVDIEELGRDLATRTPDLIDQAIDRLEPSRTAIISYTSGTSGAAKGVLLSHQALIAAATAFAAVEDIRATDESLAYLPLGWIADTMFSLVMPLVRGGPCGCPESPDTVLSDLVELGPQGFFAPHQVWEELRLSIETRILNSSSMHRRIFGYFLAVALSAERLREQGLSIPLGMNVKLALGEWLIYRPVRDKLGFGRSRWSYVGGIAPNQDTMRFFRAIGIPVKSLYGTTEMAGLVAVQRRDRGGLHPLTGSGIELRLGAGGEIEVRGPAAFSGYATAEPQGGNVVTPDGWFRTGDMGTIDQDGGMVGLRRAPEVFPGQPNAAEPAPEIEAALLGSPFIRQCLLVNNADSTTSVIVGVDLAAIERWADAESIAWNEADQILHNPRTHRLLAGEIGALTRSLQGKCRLSRFVLVSVSQDAVEADLTRFQQARHWALRKRYAALIETMGSDELPRHQASAGSPGIVTSQVIDLGRRVVLQTDPTGES
jgi:long-chain acyl-CoA synthetase